jgi:hypothetical protein
MERGNSKYALKAIMSQKVKCWATTYRYFNLIVGQDLRLSGQ